ncbi:MAG TPA: hypothetical protein VFJ19_09540 [Nocardioidaceae bacterium]|nr:hypothetical protein [Nocardioidaceae bacterium]
MSALLFAGALAVASAGLLAGWWLRGTADADELARVRTERDRWREQAEVLLPTSVVPLRRHG